MNRKITRVILILLIIVVASAIFLYLKKPSPEHSVEKFLKTFQNRDKEGMRRVYTADILSLTKERLEESVDSLVGEVLEQNYAVMEEKTRSEGAEDAQRKGSEQDNSALEASPQQSKVNETSPEDSRQGNEKADDKRKYDTKDIVDEAERKIFNFDYKIKSCKISGKQAKVKVEITSYDLGKAYREWCIESRQIKFSGEDSPDKQNIPLRLELLKSKFSDSDKTYKGEVEFRLTNKNGKWVLSDMGDTYEFLRAASGEFIYH